MLTTALPIDDVLPALHQSLSIHKNVLLIATPGAGKTTRVPLSLLHQPWLNGQRIIMLEPRRLAARNAAQFMAQQLNETVGRSVGYRIRLEQCLSVNTRIEVVTEGILTRMLQDDPELSGVGLVIFDEFHERHLHADLALALVHQCQQLWRPDLRLLVMSATLDEQALSQALNAPVIESQGRSYPVSVHYRARPSQRHSIEHLTSIIREALQHDGDVLVFLPGVKDIQQLQASLHGLCDDLLVLPLHGQLSDEQQRQALRPAPQGKRKIILSTNIAESSLTIDGIRIVIDSGLERRLSLDVARGISRLTTQHISQASATQRAGRAGRQAPGHCYRLWSEEEHARRPQHIRAEILDADLAPMLLELLQWGTTAQDVLWLTPPPLPALQQATQQLQQFGFLDAPQQLSAHGKLCAQLGIEPRFAHALVSAHQHHCANDAAELIALLQEWPHKQRHSDDLERLINQARVSPLWTERIQPLAQRLLKRLPKTSQASTTPLSNALILALAFPDRIAQRRDHSERFVLSNGRGAQLLPDSDLIHANYLAIGELSDSQQHATSQIRLASALSLDDLQRLQTLAPQLFTQHTVLEWQDNGQFLAEQQVRLGRLIIRRTPMPQLTPEQWQQAWHELILQQGLAVLPWQDANLQLRARLALMHQYDSDFPDVSDEALLNTLEDWLLPYCSEARHLRDLARIDLNHALLSLLSYPQQQRLQALLPTHFTVPSGSCVAIDYLQTPAVLAVKLQEMFGYAGQPTVLNGTLPLMLHLLSPAKRPLQITQDLPHFWQHSYQEVRKEARGRYPKHPWPEDPLSAQATKLTKNAQARTGKS